MSWADNRFVHFSFSRNPQKNCNKPIVSDIQSHENNVCDRFVSLEQNSSQLSWETMTYFQQWHCFSLKLWWILFSRDETVANVLFIYFSNGDGKFAMMRLFPEWLLIIAWRQFCKIKVLQIIITTTDDIDASCRQYCVANPDLV